MIHGCASCGRRFLSAVALDVHRRHRRSCAYAAGERRPLYRPGYLARPGLAGRRTFVAGG